MDDYCVARSGIIPPLPRTTFSLTFSAWTRRNRLLRLLEQTKLLVIKNARSGLAFRSELSRMWPLENISENRS